MTWPARTHSSCSYPVWAICAPPIASSPTPSHQTGLGYPFEGGRDRRRSSTHATPGRGGRAGDAGAAQTRPETVATEPSRRSRAGAFRTHHATEISRDQRVNGPIKITSTDLRFWSHTTGQSTIGGVASGRIGQMPLWGERLFDVPEMRLRTSEAVGYHCGVRSVEIVQKGHAAMERHRRFCAAGRPNRCGRG